MNTREGWGGCPGSQHPDPAMAGSFMSFLPPILWEGGKAPHQLHSSSHGFFSLIPFFYCTTSVPTDTQLVHHVTMEQLHQHEVARIPFFSLSYTGTSSFTHKEENYFHCSWRGWGNWLLWLQNNLFPGCFELVILEVLHPSQPSKHHLE